MNNNNRLGEHYNRYNQFSIDESNKFNYTANDFNGVFSNNANEQLSISQEPIIEYETRDNYLVVSSADRDVSAYPSASNFVINLDKEYKNIHSIELIQAIVPDKNSVTSEPYLLLRINEFETTMDTNNKDIGDSFAILQICSPPVPGSFLHIDKRIFENVTLNYTTPKASLSKLTITLTDWNGNVFDFGGLGTRDKAYQSLFVFKITTLDKERKQLNTRHLYY